MLYITIELTAEQREGFLLTTANGNFQHLTINARFVEEDLPTSTKGLGVVIHHGRAVHFRRVRICSPAAFYVQPVYHQRLPPNSPILHR